MGGEGKKEEGGERREEGRKGERKGKGRKRGGKRTSHLLLREAGQANCKMEKLQNVNKVLERGNKRKK